MIKIQRLGMSGLVVNGVEANVMCNIELQVRVTTISVSRTTNRQSGNIGSSIMCRWQMRIISTLDVVALEVFRLHPSLW